MKIVSWEYYKELYSQLEDIRSQNEGLLEENKKLREMYDSAVTANVKLQERVEELQALLVSKSLGSI
jgi:regulator of replication initiation timing